MLTSNKLDSKCRHVVDIDYMEKVMGALEAGRTVVTRLYADRAHCSVPRLLAVPHQGPRGSRVCAAAQVEEGGIFRELKAVLLTANSVRPGVYSRILVA